MIGTRHSNPQESIATATHPAKATMRKKSPHLNRSPQSIATAAEHNAAAAPSRRRGMTDL